MDELACFSEVSRELAFERFERFEFLRAHLEDGISLAAIAREAKLSYRTLQHWLARALPNIRPGSAHVDAITQKSPKFETLCPMTSGIYREARRLCQNTEQKGRPNIRKVTIFAVIFQVIWRVFFHAIWRMLRESNGRRERSQSVASNALCNDDLKNLFFGQGLHKLKLAAADLLGKTTHSSEGRRRRRSRHSDPASTRFCPGREKRGGDHSYRDCA